MRTMVAIALFLLMLGSNARAGTTGSIVGYVRASDGTPIAGVHLRFLSAAQVTDTTTDARGYFSVLDLIPGRYSVTLTRSGFIDAYFTAYVEADVQLLTREVMLRGGHIDFVRVAHHDCYSYVAQLTTSDVYAFAAPYCALPDVGTQVTNLRFAPGVTTPIIAPQRGIP